jgi:hypothetical protein
LHLIPAMQHHQRSQTTYAILPVEALGWRAKDGEQRIKECHSQ